MMTNKKTLIFLTFMMLLLLLISCKQKESSESTQETKETETDDLFDDVLSGANTADTVFADPTLWAQ